MSFYILSPRTKEWTKFGEKFDTLWDMVEASKADGIFYYGQRLTEFPDWNKKDVYLACDPVQFKFRREWIISKVEASKKEAEEYSLDIPKEAPEHYADMDSFMDSTGLTEVKPEDLAERLAPKKEEPSKPTPVKVEKPKDPPKASSTLF